MEKNVKYSLNDFTIDTDNYARIEDGIYGAKLELPLFIDEVPTYYKDKAVEAINKFIEQNKNISIASIDSIAGVLEAYINKTVNIDEKYGIVVYIWNKEENDIRDYQITLPITT